ncbi:MAG: head GIN domain-containing protein [Candidatus Marinimicrobia bacterium]|nr:head GIN domain-containing protein [Candidatus Neomarinimicrobiota bacterium]
MILDQNRGSSAKVTSYESMMELFNAKVLDGTLYLYVVDTTDGKHFHIGSDFEKFSSNALLSGSRIRWPKNDKLLDVHLSLTDLESIQVIGECEITNEDPFRGGELELDVAGALRMETKLVLEEFDVEIAGAANLELTGSCKRFMLECAGAGNIKAYEFIADDVTIDVAGACNAHIYALKSLDVNMAGLGSIKYKGNPAQTNFEKAGIGKIRKAESNNVEL